MSREDEVGLFVGDRSDPWVKAIAAILPPGVAVAEGPGLPDRWPDGGMLVLHRGALEAAEADRLRSLRAERADGRVLLIVGPHVRYQQIHAWTAAGLVDEVLTEATAREVLARRLRPDPRPRPGRSRARVAVTSSQRALADLIADACTAAGYATARRPEGPEAGDEPWVVWDVPVLEPGWADRLAVAAQRRGVVALLGLADRETVALARRSGAVACLDLPVDPGDLIAALDRLTGRDRDLEPGPPPATARRVRPPSAPSRR